VFREGDPELVRLDYGENEAPMPQPLIEGLIAALLAPHEAQEQHGLAEAVIGFLLETRAARYTPEDIVLGQGVWPLMHHLGVALRQRLGRAPRVFIATPCYGVLPPTWVAAGCEVELGPVAALQTRRGPGAPDVAVISQPSNPSGCYLSHEELVALATWAVDQRALLVSDEIFGLLNLTNPTAETVHSPVTLEQVVPGVGARTVVLGGLSKEFAAGGLRLGWLATRDRGLATALRESGLVAPTLATARAAAWLYVAYARSPEGRLLYPERHRALREFLIRMRRELAEKRALIAEALPEEGLSDTTAAGGLFLAPRVDSWLGKEVEGERLTVENLPRVVYAQTHVVLNGGEWCGDPERVRVVFSIPRDKLERARERLRAFASRLRPH
jgi:aspartate/methionine/tyrosine aminotransferase